MAILTPIPTPPAAPDLELPALSKARMMAAIKQIGWNHEVDEDGDIAGQWEKGEFHFFIDGPKNELLCVRGTWFGALEESDYSKALECANEWNRDKQWPKAYVDRDDEHEICLMVEHNVDYEYGLSDAQLRQHLTCAVSSSNAFFDHLTERFPQAGMP